MQNAAERLLWLSADEIKEPATDIIISLLRLATLEMTADDIINGKDKLLRTLD